jgi:uncharacterized protein
MPEYLSPGVFIEEIPARLKAIEGVSTSTAGLVGRVERGSVAGFPMPFKLDPLTDAQKIVLPQDAAPVLVTSFAEFARGFGVPPDDPDNKGYLAHAVRAFFDNGGKRTFIARVVKDDAKRTKFRLGHGTVLLLTRHAEKGKDIVYLNSLRQVAASGGAQISFFNAADGTLIQTVTPSSYDTLAGSVTFAPVLTQDLEPDKVYAVPSGAAAFAAETGPEIFARSPGEWGNDLRVVVRASDRPATPILANAAATDVIQVRSNASFYQGAILELDHGGGNTLREYYTVKEVLPGNRLRLNVNLLTPVVVPAPPAAPPFARVAEIDIGVVDMGTGRVETYRNLTWNPDNADEVRRRHYSTAINNRSALIYIRPPGVGITPPPTPAVGSEAFDPDNQPMTFNGFAMGPLPVVASDVMGADGSTPLDADYVGTDAGPGTRSGIQSLQDVDDIRIIAVPGVTTQTVQNALIIQAENMRYRFAVLDGERDPSPSSVVNEVLKHRNAYDSSYAAYYSPWVQIGAGDQTLFLPSSGHVIGIYARTDNDRGVWKAPANEVVRGITGLTSYYTTGEQDLLNPRGVNAIRRFEGRGIRVWGARTLSSDPEFRYVNVRRFLIFMEASIDRGTQWVVFEPNAPDTWSRVVDSVTAFLNTQWRAGALFGRKPEDAFYVRCDETTMTVDDVQNGRLICDIGVAIVRPAEFVIFRIEQITGFGTKS